MSDFLLFQKVVKLYKMGYNIYIYVIKMSANTHNVDTLVQTNLTVGLHGTVLKV